MSITDEIDMVVDKSTPLVEIGVAERNRLKEETESYRAKVIFGKGKESREVQF